MNKFLEKARTYLWRSGRLGVLSEGGEKSQGGVFGWMGLRASNLNERLSCCLRYDRWCGWGLDRGVDERRGCMW